MSYVQESFGRDLFAADAALDQRVAFIRRVYAHVGGATLLLAGLVGGIINTPELAEPLARFAFAQWWVVLIGYMVASSVAHRMAASHASPGMQYLGLGLFVLRNFLWTAMLAAIGLMLVAAFTSFSLGTWFVAGMVLLMAGFILYETSNVLHHYSTTEHVAAALAVFSSLTTLFWYVLQLVSAFSDD
jgi:FtsH-binding integral membrane protein